MTPGYRLGIDIGSTTVKLALVDPATDELLYHRYVRHGARQRSVTAELAAELAREYPDATMQAIFTGSGGKAVADTCGLSHIQEVVANSVAVRRFFPETRVAIELGGQDAKVIFFRTDPATGELRASDMRMNGSCAGGTGAFVDEMAKLLRTPVEEFDRLAAAGSAVHQISGRCGVFAKTDIQPLLNQGVDRSDLALSTFHAIARQTIGGLAQGLQIRPPVLFQGGPLTFQRTLVGVFADKLNLEPDEVVQPERPEIFVAHGAALSIPVIFPETPLMSPGELAQLLAEGPGATGVSVASNDDGVRFFSGDQERAEFFERHRKPDFSRRRYPEGTEVDVYVGVDGGSTTSKVVLLDGEDNLIDHAYAHNAGEPLKTTIRLLREVLGRYDAEGVELRVRGLGTTGYGEKMLAAAFHADYHTVETVAHAHAALRVDPTTSFVLDIGGQDMKAITVSDGIVTGINLNEACSAGCGSFLENFATTLDVPVDTIADRAFSSKAPSRLGSRCTVFMNSSIITEQRNGKGPNDILAGLCHSIVENVFTKVVRVPNFALLGETVMVQGGTFENDAVLRALELYTGRRVVRAPFPGLMGAIGIGMLTREAVQSRPDRERSTNAIQGLASLQAFSFRRESGNVCPFCANACSRTVVHFSDGSHYITGNRCERGLRLHAEEAPEERRREDTPDLTAERERLLFSRPPIEPIVEFSGRRVGIPRALEFWHSYPFWHAFWSALGHTVVLSRPSSRRLFESGLSSVPSDTVCFPAKLSHGHLLDLLERKVDLVFMPMINRMPPENRTTKSNHVCAVVKGYPLVLDVSDEPERRYGIPFERPMFHWVDHRSRREQIIAWAKDQFGVSRTVAARAIDLGDEAQRVFSNKLQQRGADVLEQLEGSDRFGVVIAGRPYHSDRLVNHDLASSFVQQGIPVLTADSLPGIEKADLSRTRVELTVNFHVRMYAAAMHVAQNPNLELVQVVSFGCGHDAVISDEVVRLLEESSDKTPLTLKLDETDVRGPMSIRIRSFVETIRARRRRAGGSRFTGLPDPFTVKYEQRHRREKVILVPNLTRSFAQVISSVVRRQGYRVEPVPMADRRAIELGKRYVHNDMCFPAQINVGEFLRFIERSDVDPDNVVCALAKAHCDCRLAHYATLARKALDDAGYKQIPIITTDTDTKNMHPGFRLSPLFELRMLWAIAVIDAFEALRRRLRPYEIEPGSIDRVFERQMDRIEAAVEGPIRRVMEAFERGVDELSAVPIDASTERERVFVIGEFLLNFHPTSNFNVERYLEANGMEVVLPNILDSFRRDFMRLKTERREFFVRHPFVETLMVGVTDVLFDHVLDKVARIAERNPRYHRPMALPEVAKMSEEIVHHTFTSGEGWMIAGDILHHAGEGIRSFLILQPFGCLPNHITGRGLIKRLKELHPEVQILSLDYDPDTSFANIENRLQMLILNSRLGNVTRTGQNRERVQPGGKPAT